MKLNPYLVIYLTMDHNNVVYSTVLVRRDSLSKNSSPSPVQQDLKKIKKQESPYISENKYQLQKHPYQWLCVHQSYSKCLPQNTPQQKHTATVFCIVYQGFLKVQYIFPFPAYILQTES